MRSYDTIEEGVKPAAAPAPRAPLGAKLFVACAVFGVCAFAGARLAGVGAARAAELAAATAPAPAPAAEQRVPKPTAKCRLGGTCDDEPTPAPTVPDPTAAPTVFAPTLSIVPTVYRDLNQPRPTMSDLSAKDLAASAPARVPKPTAKCRLGGTCD